jgi:putative nucleotidyltransferase with HDIG domain
MPAGDPLEAAVLQAFGDHGERADVEDCDLRIVGPAELAAHGARVLRRHRMRCPRTPALAIHAADASATLVRECFRAGAGDVIAEGEIQAELHRSIEGLLLRFSARRDRDRETELLAAELGKHARDLEATLERLRESYDQTLNALVAALDMRERETAFHSQRVAAYSVLVGVRLGLDDTELENLYRGALLHDIGKIGTPDAVLLKPGKFTEEEWVVMRRHAESGGRMLDSIGFLREASDVPHSHHEAWNGGGYPAKLAGEAIPLHARIFAVVDSYDAIRSKRPYKEPMTHAQALEQLDNASGKRLDPELVEVFKREPQATWSEIEKSLEGVITFSTCIATCRSLS